VSVPGHRVTLFSVEETQRKTGRAAHCPLNSTMEAMRLALGV
jgi:hypothetical protein